MKISRYNIEASVLVEFTTRDLELLDNVTSYGAEKWADTICGDRGNSYNGGVSKAEMVQFINKLHAIAGVASKSINEHAKKGIVNI